MKVQFVKIAALAALWTGCVVGAQAQIQREVDVTRAYEPSVQHSLKLNIMPDMTDTAQMRPNFNYEITPRPLSYGFAVNPLIPAKIAAVGGPVRFPFYAKIGAGGPLQSVADLRYAKALSDRTDFGAYATHYGRYGKIENDMAVKESAFGTNNSAGAFLDFRPTEAFAINAELGYDFRNVTRYGYYSPAGLPSWFDTDKDNLKQFYHDVKARVSFGNDFVNTGRFNFRLGAGVDYFAERYKYDQIRWDLGALFGFQAGADGFLTIGVKAHLTTGQQNLDGYSNQLGNIGLAYHFDNSDFRFRLGAAFGFSEVTAPGSDESDFKGIFLPELLLEKDLADGALTPFVDIRSHLTDNSFGELMKRNPYTFSGTFAPNTINYNGRAGIKGMLGGSFKYKVYAGYDMLKDNVYWANAREYSAIGNAFTVVTDSLNIFQAGIELQANILNAVTLHGALNYSNYNSKHYDSAGDLPDLKLDFDVTYNHRNRLYITAGAVMSGERVMYEYTSSALASHIVPWQMDLRLGADYYINKQFGVFVQLNNLLNHDMYDFNRYRELGINGQVGVKLSF